MTIFFFQRGCSTLKPMVHTMSSPHFCSQWLWSPHLRYYLGKVRQASTGVMERMSSPAPGEGGTLDNLHLHPGSLGKGINSASTSGQWSLMLLRQGHESPP